MSEETLRELRKLNATFIHNFVTNDVPSHDRITHRDFVCINSSGGRVGREEYLRRWATGFDPARIVYWDYRDETISLFGSTALVRATNKHITVQDSVETVGMTTYTDTYIRENGEWKCIQAQLTPVTPANYPSDETIVKKYVKGQVQP